MYTLNDYCRETFGEKLYKISLNGGFTCPNRDGTLGQPRLHLLQCGRFRGFYGRSSCLYYGTDRSREEESRKENEERRALHRLFSGVHEYVCPARKTGSAFYCGDLTSGYPCALSRYGAPDCIPEETVALLARLNRIKPVWVELGLQTIHEESARYIRRGYPLAVYEDALRRLKEAGLTVITHVILGLPGETREDMLETIKYLAKGIKDTRTDGIKLQLLHVLRNTDLA